MLLQMIFITENCQRIMDMLTFLEGTRSSITPLIYICLVDLEIYLHVGTTKQNFDEKTDQLLQQVKPADEKRKVIKEFHSVFKTALNLLGAACGSPYIVFISTSGM